MNLLDKLNRGLVAGYLASPLVLTLLVHQHVIGQVTSVDIAAIILSVGGTFHLGQAAKQASVKAAQKSDAEAGLNLNAGFTPAVLDAGKPTV